MMKYDSIRCGTTQYNVAQHDTNMSEGASSGPGARACDSITFCVLFTNRRAEERGTCFV